MQPHRVNLAQDAQALFLIVDGEESRRESLAAALEAAGYCAEQVANGQMALRTLELKPYAGVIIDVDLDDLDGTALIQQARDIQPDLLIVVLTGQPSLRSAVAALKAGAADYILRPAAVSVVLEAVNNALAKQMAQRSQLWQMVQEVLRASNEFTTTPSTSFAADNLMPSQILIVPPIRLDRARRQVTFTDNQTSLIRLSRGETAVLFTLMSYPDHPVSLTQLVHHAWDYILEHEEARTLIGPYIFRLRQKLEADPKRPQLILTIPHKGYLFVSGQRPPVNIPAGDSI
jgi:DNA-binding response OmpR family regulator